MLQRCVNFKAQPAEYVAKKKLDWYFCWNVAEPKIILPTSRQSIRLKGKCFLTILLTSEHTFGLPKQAANFLHNWKSFLKSGKHSKNIFLSYCFAKISWILPTVEQTHAVNDLLTSLIIAKVLEKDEARQKCPKEKVWGQLRVPVLLVLCSLVRAALGILLSCFLNSANCSALPIHPK